VVGPEVLTVTFQSSSVDQLSLAELAAQKVLSSPSGFRPQGAPIIGKRVNFSINSRVGGHPC